MSVTFHLYKPCDNIHYLGRKYDFATKDEKNKMNKLLQNYSNTTNEDDEWIDDFLKDRYSDNQKHEIIDVTWYKRIYKLSSKYKGYYSLYKKLQSFNQDTIFTTLGLVNKYIVVDEIVYRQGWFLKNKFLKKGTTIFIATNKKEMKLFFKKYLDVKDKKGIEAYKTFTDKWEDGMIFMVAW